MNFEEVGLGIKIRKNIFPFKEFHSPKRPCLKLTDDQLRLIGDFNHKVKKGDIEFEAVPCLCGCGVFDLIASVDRHSMLQRTVLCTKCGLIQSNPRMTEKEYINFYSSDYYRKSYESDEYLNICRQKYSQNVGQHIFDEINRIKTINSDVSILEIGAGGGWNLLPFAKSNARVLGIDYSPSLVSLGRGYGIDMVQGTIEDIDGIFDVIIMSHVLEHLLNPVESLKGIVKHLKDDGLIYIAVPNILNFGIGQLQNAHTYYFDPKTFVYYCSLAGLKSVSFGPAQNIHMFGIYAAHGKGCYDSELNNHFCEINKHLKRFRFRYCIGKIKRLLLKEKI